MLIVRLWYCCFSLMNHYHSCRVCHSRPESYFNPSDREPSCRFLGGGRRIWRSGHETIGSTGARHIECRRLPCPCRDSTSARMPLAVFRWLFRSLPRATSRCTNYLPLAAYAGLSSDSSSHWLWFLRTTCDYCRSRRSNVSICCPLVVSECRTNRCRTGTLRQSTSDCFRLKKRIARRTKGLALQI